MCALFILEIYYTYTTYYKQLSESNKKQQNHRSNYYMKYFTVVVDGVELICRKSVLYHM